MTKNTPEMETGNTQSTEVFSVQNYILLDTYDNMPSLSLDKPFIIEGFVMVMCIKGSLQIKLNHKEFLISAGQILTILPNHIIRITGKSDDCFATSFMFGGDFIAKIPLQATTAEILLNIDQSPVISVAEEDMQNLLELHALITRHNSEKRRAYRENTIEMLLYSLILEIGTLYAENEKPAVNGAVSRQEEITRRFFILLRENFKTEHNVAFYADALCLTPKYLSATIKQTTGRSVLKWIDEAIIIQAKKMLKTTNLTVLQISEELNFPNPSFFGRFFKQYAGTTPLRYRNK